MIGIFKNSLEDCFCILVLTNEKVWLINLTNDSIVGYQTYGLIIKNVY